MPILQEELLEPVARYLRFREIIKHIEKYIDIDVADIGAGPKTPFKTFLSNNGFQIKSYTAIDPLSEFADNNVKHINKPIVNKIPLRSNSKDFVVAAAFIEHINNPKEVLNEMLRITKPKGKVILTTPTHHAKNILQFLSAKLSLISRREIQEHKNYFDKITLLSLMSRNKKNVKVLHRYFEYGLNNLLVIEKLQ